MILDYFYIAFTNLRSRGIRSWLTMIGIFIGIAAVVALFSLGQGLKEAVNSQFSAIGADKLIIMHKSPGFGPPGASAAGVINDKDLKVIEKVNGVELAAGRLLKPARIEFNDKQFTSYVTTLPAGRGSDLVIKINNLKAVEGRLLKSTDKKKAVVGFDYSQKDLLGKAVMVGNAIFVNGEKFSVVGIAGKLGDPGRDRAIWINEDDGRELFNDPENFDMILVQISSAGNPSKIAGDVSRSLRRSRHESTGKESFDVQTPEQIFQSFTTLLTIVQVVLIGIAAISLVVGGIGIMNTMYTSVLERTREIGIMKAVGAKKSDVLFIMVVESGLLGMCGGFIGVFIGIVLSKSVEVIAEKSLGTALIQAYISPSLILGAVAFSFFVGVISGLVPARKAASLQPIEALRYE